MKCANRKTRNLINLAGIKCTWIMFFFKESCFQKILNKYNNNLSVFTNLWIQLLQVEMEKSLFLVLAKMGVTHVQTSISVCLLLFIKSRGICTHRGKNQEFSVALKGSTGCRKCRRLGRKTQNQFICTRRERG